ncbi:hypothetical protein ACJIZ3_013200 [Penstemon smallii]|uniref:E2 ubiquitin-conjugating enzyme n=1 Tax=Penstemon smallii TaxID=265156 RepID=A0ABD3US36_9LAMI
MDSLLSDFDSHSESSSSEDQDDIESLFGGQARSIFSSLEESIEKIDDFLLFERGFTHGDVVCMVSDPSGQTGKVFNKDMTVDLENTYGCKIHNVSAKTLHKILPMSIGDYVVHEAWIGKVEKIIDRVTILFDDGTKCKITNVAPEKIISISPDLIEDLQCSFYPGQRVRIESSSVTKSNWLCGMRNEKNEQGTVCCVEAGLVYVNWLSGKGPAPPFMLDSKDLTLLSSFTRANWQLGDWCLIPNRDQSRNFEQIAVIVKTRTKVDVQWQDGSQALGLDSNLLFPVNIDDVHDFWPGSFVLEKGTVDDNSQRWGIVNSVDSKERTAKVKWFESKEEDIVSAYELVEHPDYSYCFGEAVFRTDKSVAKTQMTEEDDLKAVEYFSNNFLSCIGIVVGFVNGDVEVTWASGATSKVAPYDIYRVDQCEGTSATFVLSDENVQQSHEELSVKDNQLLGQKTQDMSGLSCGNAKDSSSYSPFQIAFGIVTSVTSSLFGSLSTSLIGAYKLVSEDAQILGKPPVEEVLEICNLTHDEQVKLVDDLERAEKKTLEQIKEANEVATLPSGSKHIEYFKQFDMVNDCSDHHFVDGSGIGLQSSLVNRGWLKKVHQEWSILEKDLPESIYVRVFEERMDLIRAAIVGTSGTPYHDNLFFFDIYLPPQYPNEPPMVYYNSGGLRINPNLYESGKVCLSLLNTWTGSHSEVWNPGSSTVLQILISLQSLVLNEKPYFNEAGYDSQIGKAEGEKNSFTYNENAFLVSCRSMLYLLRKPPMNFEALVDEHFSRGGRSILLACKAYLRGAPIGYPLNCENDDEENQKGSSAGFKIMLAKLVPKLVEAFSDKGVDCDFLDQVL